MSQESPSRRRLLTGLASAITVGTLAGCSSGTGGETTTETTAEENGGETETETETPTPTTTATKTTTTATPTPQTETVLVGPNAKNAFDPAELEIEPGTTVTFVWKASGHSLVVGSQPDGAEWNGVPETQGSGYEHSHTFEVAGTYEYYCDPHKAFGMEGTITVSE